MRIFTLKKMSFPKMAVIATGLTAAVMVATINPAAPAQAYPRAASCVGCHGAASGAVATVTATPSTATPAAGATYTVAITQTANPTGGNTGYGIVPVTAGTGSTFGGNTGAELSHTATMTAPLTVGTYSYTVYTNQGPTSAGLVGIKVYSITVAAVVTIPPTTIPPTTVPVTTVPPTTVPPTTVPVTTVPPTTVPPTTVPVTTVPPTTVPPTTVPAIIAPIRVGEDSTSPNSVLGQKHLSMYNLKGANCAACHDGSYVPTPPSITGDNINMAPGISCRTCHTAGGREDPLFISLMNNTSKVVYNRCSDCHKVVSPASSGDGGSDD